MLNDTLQAIYTSIKENDQTECKKLVSGLNKIGMDNYTIRVLINELVKEGTIK